MIAALVVPLVGRVSARLAHGITVVAPAVALVCAVMALRVALDSGPWHYYLGGWAPPWGIEYVVDPLGGGMAVLVALLATLVAIYAGPHLRALSPRRAAVFNSLFLLLTSGLLGITLTGDLFNLYVFFEISSLAAYALLASGGERAIVATFRYLLIGTIAASFYLLGIGYLYALTGTVNMADLAMRLPQAGGGSAMTVGVVLIVVGLAIKMAVFPLHGWMPDAYTYAPPPVTMFIAAVMSKVSAYALLRVLFFVLPRTGAVETALSVLSWVAAGGVLAGSVLALAQTDVRRMLAYSSVGQMGYVVLGLSIGNAAALTGALLHIMGHAVAKASLFGAVASLPRDTVQADIAGFAGASRRAPLTMAAFTLAALSLVGMPPTAGFFSKWYLLRGAIEADAWLFAAVLLVSSLLSAVYFFRVIERIYFAPDPAAAEPDRSRRHPEVSLRLLGPVITLSAAVLLIGLFNGWFVTTVIRHALPEL
ncbi:MAG: NADH/ubiquinone/plastoquinone (complex I) [Acidobacteria bacterium]|nr:MAG: NADH/ubiquinone/plastoquinone (complex I) [Acidobacteriota bacterium]